MARSAADIPDDELDCSPANVRHLMTMLEIREDIVETVDETLENYRALHEQWIEAFRMEEDERGVMIWSADTMEALDGYAELLDEHERLVRDWNAQVDAFNRANRVARDPGRPLAASEAQCADVRRRRAAGE